MSAIRVLPAMHLIRRIYTALILVKLHFAAVTSSNEDTRLQIDRLQVFSRLHYSIRMIRSWFEDSDIIKRDGSWLNVWRLGPAYQSPVDTQSSTDLVGSNDGSLLSPGSQDPPWIVSVDPSDMETMRVSFNSSLDFSGSAFTPTSIDQPIDYSLLPSQISPSAPNVSVGDDLGMNSNMIDKRNIDVTLDMDLELNQLPSMHFDPNNLQLPSSHDSDGFYENYTAEDTRRND
ncbi:hypothetical protein ANOM_004923 [Aspergillus nomiae NRRL 13137]|uniref:C6 transcription factor n=1 Tax=Aspergillus nomiae NRRL (strain ATCC 15546 / NRRL 13137 / CBS 260.88 / M93) TaxID=1509407 RepID=A0A0L1J529_ASPN3|nr:uncharacterized protein ANOM_004923 [Aspergillus nomiae NRRL 13137]KNG86849.1 hypothetical protein ANOM_004923 [Aspergillus nomiae NRRL 13137]